MSGLVLAGALVVLPILAQEAPDSRAPESEKEDQQSEPEQKPRSKPVSEQDRLSAQNEVKIFFGHIILGDAAALADDAAIPFYLEDRKINSREELASEWSRNLKEKRTDLLVLYNVEILAPAEMEKKYGKPPARLKSFPWRAARTLIAVANLSGHAAIVLVTRTDDNWRVSGFTD